MALGNDAAAPRPARCGCTDVDALWRQHAAYLRAGIARIDDRCFAALVIVD